MNTISMIVPKSPVLAAHDRLGDSTSNAEWLRTSSPCSDMHDPSAEITDYFECDPMFSFAIDIARSVAGDDCSEATSEVACQQVQKMMPTIEATVRKSLPHTAPANDGGDYAKLHSEGGVFTDEDPDAPEWARASVVKSVSVLAYSVATYAVGSDSDQHEQAYNEGRDLLVKLTPSIEAGVRQHTSG